MRRTKEVSEATYNYISQLVCIRNKASDFIHTSKTVTNEMREVHKKWCDGKMIEVTQGIKNVSR